MLREDDKAPHFIKVNWDKSVDEDKDKCGKYLDVGGMDCFEIWWHGRHGRR
jgi:prostaglandin-E synthase